MRLRVCRGMTTGSLSMGHANQLHIPQEPTRPSLCNNEYVEGWFPDYTRRMHCIVHVGQAYKV